MSTDRPEKVKNTRSSLRRAARLSRSRWWWKRTFKWPALRAWHRFRWGVVAPPSMMAKTGRGKYVDVLRHGPYVEITDHASGEMIRMIPFQENHGYMVELHTVDGRVSWRTHLDFKALRKIGHLGGEAALSSENTPGEATP